MIKAVKRVLILTGRPVYFVLSQAALGLALLSHAISQWDKKRKKTKVIYRSFNFPKLKFPRLTLPKFEFPSVGPTFKLKELRFTLLELKVLSRIKKTAGRLSKKIRARKFKPTLRLVLPVCLLLFLMIAFYFYILRGLPSPKELDAREPEVSTKIYDRNGNLLYKIYKDQNRSIVPLTQIPIHVRLATLAAEDAEFYSHPGFSIRGIFRAVVQDLQTDSIQGGSTITQQLVKNTLLTPEKTITRKIKELILSIEVEANYTKDQILEMYLNEVSYGGTAYGIQEASESYFGKDVGSLDLAEAALLAGLPRSPTTYSPF